METNNPLDFTARIERLERQNLILKIIGLTGLFILSALFVVNTTSARGSQVVAQKFIITDDNGKECGYLGFDPTTKNPRLSLKQCNGSMEQIGLLIEKDSASLRLDALGLPTAFMTANRAEGMAKLELNGQAGSPGGSSGVAYLSSGSTAVPPQFFLEGREKGRVDIWGGRHYFRVQDSSSLTRFLIDKLSTDDVALHFYDKNGAETHHVP